MTNLNMLSALQKAKLRAAAIVADEKARKEKMVSEVLAHREMELPDLVARGWQYDTSVEWNAEQLQAISAAMAGKSFCLIGAAGTGKTTTLKGIVYSLLKNNITPLIDRETKYLKIGTPGVVLVSFTNMAVRQIAKHFSGDITCLTIHKLLEYAPTYYDVEDEATGETRTKMQFEPSFHQGNKLPSTIRTIFIDESSMVDTELVQKLMDALPSPARVQFIYLGDLNQLPPVYGGPILGKRLLDSPIIELTRVYRQALESPIIRFAIDMKDGKAIPVSEKIAIDNGAHGQVLIQPWSKRLNWEDALLKAQNWVKSAWRDGMYDPMQDMILCPYNVKFGVLELNSALADYMGRQRGAIVHEVIAGFRSHYLAVGDKVLVNKQEGIIVRIQKNPRYIGKTPIDAKRFVIDRWGGASKIKDGKEVVLDIDAPDFDIDDYIDNMQLDGGVNKEQRKAQASHSISIQLLANHDPGAPLDDDPDSDFLVDTSAGVNEMLFGYCCTVHKSQGSEWRRVFLILHHFHSRMCSRELVYTAMTRAKNFLYIICEPDRVSSSGTLTKAAKTPRLKGNTLAEKLISLKEKFDKEAAEAATNQKPTTEEEETE